MTSNSAGSTGCDYQNGEYPIEIMSGKGLSYDEAERCVIRKLESMPETFQWTRAWLSKGLNQGFLTGSATGKDVLKKKYRDLDALADQLTEEVATLKKELAEKDKLLGCFSEKCDPLYR
jgi:hypothetical protein